MFPQTVVLKLYIITVKVINWIVTSSHLNTVTDDNFNVLCSNTLIRLIHLFHNHTPIRFRIDSALLSLSSVQVQNK